MKKVLFLIESLSGGGAERVLTDLVKNIDKSKFDVTVTTVVDTGVYVGEVKKACSYNSFLPAQCYTASGMLKQLLYNFKYKLIYTFPASIVYRCFIRDKYDVEVAFVEGFVTKVIAASNNKKSLKLAWVHVDPINRDYADHYFSSYHQHVNAYNKFDKILCVSKDVADAFNQKFKLKEKALVQYNPIDREAILQKATEKIDIKKDKVTLVTAGRLTEQKGYDRLLKICKRLKDNGFDFKLWILGEGEQRSSLENYIKENKLDEIVKLLGFHSNPYPYIKMADIFVCSSRTEGFSTVATEAIILGKPVIATDCAGMRELLGENEHGIVVENNCEALYKALKEVLSDKDILKKIECKAKNRSKYFNINTNIKKIEDILESN
ncbi:glycosyltransferase [Clostridium thermarum]|uniref:glycosyltransferase n=1 Tax=Clostridium thermarum TaxID=1716543 RepID=UPI0013D67F00|nr:glycosyltransferase [Clostridium thermarum]